MRPIFLTIVGILFLSVSTHASAEIGSMSLEGGWTAWTKKDDPFDESKKSILNISKDDFYVTCTKLSFPKLLDTSYDTFTYSATIMIKIDNQSPQKLQGRYSTYQEGMALVTDDRWFSFVLPAKIIEELKKGNTLKAAGKFLEQAGWSTTRTLNLLGFTKAYNKMCP
jgi:hypothetical protein